MNEPTRRTDVNLNRRDLLKNAALATAGVTVAALATEGCAEMPRLSMATNIPAPKARETVRVGFVGVGGMGSGHVNNLMKIEGVELKAVCDIVPEKVARVQDMCVKAGKPKPTGYSKGPEDFRRLCETEDLDLVYTATPWEWHVPVCVAALKAGKHAATEVPASMTVEGCWQLVETAEKVGKHAVMMENCCYDRSEMMVMHMIRKGVFGDLLHAECGYMHDLRGVKFGNGGEGLWRRNWAAKLDANLYPTHGLGPVAQYMDINRGDRFDYLVSVSGPSKGLQAYAEHLPADDPRRKEKYVLGDVNSTLIKTVKGLTILLQHDTNLPRPYSRLLVVQGTKGIFRGWPDQIHIEGRTEGHDWEPVDKYRQEFDHPLWKAMQDKSKGAGHGGMDFIEDFRLIRALRTGRYPDQDVYDAAAWSAPVELTAKSVANRSRPADFPDFTRGRWKTTPPMGILEA